MRQVNPAIKLISLLAVTLILAWRRDPLLNFAVFLLCFAAMVCSRVRLRVLGLLMLPILLAALGMFFTGFRFSADGGMPVRAENLLSGGSALRNGLTQASRVLAYGSVGYLFALTTDGITLVRSLQRQFRIPQIFAYGLLAAWGMFPHMVLEFRRTRAAFRARGLRPFPVSPTLLKPLLVKSVRWSEALAMAMESKGFSGSAVRSQMEPVLVKPGDWWFLLLTTGFTLAVAIIL